MPCIFLNLVSVPRRLSNLLRPCSGHEQRADQGNAAERFAGRPRTSRSYSPGKKSRKVHGLYKPESREIIIHNRNFTNDNELLYTAIHEYAHHIQFTTSATPMSVRTHTTAFWNLFHTLLFEAEGKGIYTNPFEQIEELRDLTRRIREKFLAAKRIPDEGAGEAPHPGAWHL